MNGFIALARIAKDEPLFSELVKGNVLLFLAFQTSYGEGYVYRGAYEEIAKSTGLHLSSVKRRLTYLEKEGLIERSTWKQGSRSFSKISLRLDHPLFRYLEGAGAEPQTGLETGLETGLDGEPEKPLKILLESAGVGLETGLETELETEPQTDLKKNNIITIKQHLINICSGTDDGKPDKAIELATDLAREWNEVVGTKKQLSKSNAVAFLRHLQKDRDVDMMKRLNRFLPHSYMDYKINGNAYAFRSDKPERWLDDNKWLGRIRAMEKWERETGKCVELKEIDLPDHLKKIDDDPFYKPTQNELREYRELKGGR